MNEIVTTSDNELLVIQKTDKVFSIVNKVLNNIKWFENLIRWADKNNIPEKFIPRDINKIKNTTYFSLDGFDLTDFCFQMKINDINIGYMDLNDINDFNINNILCLENLKYLRLPYLNLFQEILTK